MWLNRSLINHTNIDCVCYSIGTKGPHSIVVDRDISKRARSMNEEARFVLCDTINAWSARFVAFHFLRAFVRLGCGALCDRRWWWWSESAFAMFPIKCAIGREIMWSTLWFNFCGWYWVTEMECGDWYTIQMNISIEMMVVVQFTFSPRLVLRIQLFPMHITQTEPHI